VKIELKSLINIDWNNKSSKDKADAASTILKYIDKSEVGKGRFAQVLADKLATNIVTITVP